MIKWLSSLFKKEQAPDDPNDRLSVMRRAILLQLEKISSAVSPDGKKNLRFVSENLTEILDVANQKMALCKQDGENHSVMFGKEPDSPCISVSCWPCLLTDLKSAMEREIGSYPELLQRNFGRAQSNGFNSFIHLFICEGGHNIGAAIAYADIGFKELVMPEELK